MFSTVAIGHLGGFSLKHQEETCGFASFESPRFFCGFKGNPKRNLHVSLAGAQGRAERGEPGLEIPE